MPQPDTEYRLDDVDTVLSRTGIDAGELDTFTHRTRPVAESEAVEG